MARLALFGFGVAFGAPFAYGVVTLSRTLAAPPQLTLTLLAGMPALSALAIWIAVRSGPSAQKRGVAGLAGLVAVLYGVELWLPRSENIAALRAIEARGTPDRRGKTQVIADARAAGLQAVTMVEPKSLLEFLGDGTARSRLTDGGAELQPLSGVSNRETVVCNEMGEWITYRSDRCGMNNPDAVWDRDTVPVAAVGDAFANGWCTPAGEHFVTLIREDRMDLINLGQSGNGPLLTLASVLEYLPSKRPRFVLWFQYELNDFRDLSIERLSPLLLRYLEEGGGHQNLLLRQDAVDRALETYLEADVERWADQGLLLAEPMGWIPTPGTVVDFAKLAHLRGRLGVVYHDPFPADHELWSRVIAKAKGTVEEWGGRLIVVYLPAAPRYQSAVERASAERSVERMRADLGALGVSFVDDQAFRTVANSLSLFNRINGGGFGHYTSQGHRLIAESVRSVLAAAGGER